MVCLVIPTEELFGIFLLCAFVGWFRGSVSIGSFRLGADLYLRSFQCSSTSFLFEEICFRMRCVIFGLPFVSSPWSVPTREWSWLDRAVRWWDWSRCSFFCDRLLASPVLSCFFCILWGVYRVSWAALFWPMISLFPLAACKETVFFCMLFGVVCNFCYFVPRKPLIYEAWKTLVHLIIIKIKKVAQNKS